VREDGAAVEIVPHDGARTRLFVAPAGQWITLAAGTIAKARWVPATHRIELTLDPATTTTPVAQLSVEAPAGGAAYAIGKGTAERGFTTIALSPSATTVTLTPR